MEVSQQDAMLIKSGKVFPINDVIVQLQTQDVVIYSWRTKIKRIPGSWL